MKQSLRLLAVVAIISSIFAGYSPVQAASDQIDLELYPSVWTLDTENSGLNMIAVKSKNGYTGTATVSLTDGPSWLLDRFPTGAELAEGKSGYYCSSHCQAAPNADFPVSLTMRDGQWTAFGPTLLLGDPPSGSYNLTITASTGTSSVSKSVTLKVVNINPDIDPQGGPLIFPSTYADPDAYVTLNNNEFSAHAYKFRIAAGTTTTTAFNFKTNRQNPVTATLASNLTSSGLSGVTDKITGGFTQSTASVNPGETQSLDYRFTTASDTPSGTYELIAAIRQNNGSTMATVGISLIVDGVTPTTAPTTTPSATTIASASPTGTAMTTSTPTITPTPTPTSSTTETPSPTPTETTVSPEPTLTETSRVISEPSLHPQSAIEPAVTQAKIDAVEASTTIAVTTIAATLPLAIGAPTSLVAGVSWTGTVLVSIVQALLEIIGVRRRRFPWGTVFRADTDQPLELAIVRIFTADGRLLETRVTDRAGRFAFLADPGKYRLEVSKPGFRLSPLATSRNFHELYEGGLITVSDKTGAIMANIAMEELDNHHWVGRILRPLAASFHQVSLFAGVPVAWWQVATLPNWMTMTAATILTILLIGEWLVILPRGFGFVRELPWRRKLGGVVLRLARADTGKVLVTQVSDRFGRYSFLVRPGTYKILLPNGSWQLPVWLTKPITITSGKGGLINWVIDLKKDDAKSTH